MDHHDTKYTRTARLIAERFCDVDPEERARLLKGLLDEHDTILSLLKSANSAIEYALADPAAARSELQFRCRQIKHLLDKRDLAISD